jgi:hypothetical protein
MTLGQGASDWANTVAVRRRTWGCDSWQQCADDGSEDVGSYVETMSLLDDCGAVRIG